MASGTQIGDGGIGESIPYTESTNKLKKVGITWGELRRHNFVPIVGSYLNIPEIVRANGLNPPAPERGNKKPDRKVAPK
jgi:hypothetical protein